MRHWNNTGKRGLALFLALLMCMNLLSLTAFAAESDEITQARAELASAQAAFASAKDEYDTAQGAYDTAHDEWQAAKDELTSTDQYKAYLEYAALTQAQNDAYFRVC